MFGAYAFGQFAFGQSTVTAQLPPRPDPTLLVLVNGYPGPKVRFSSLSLHDVLGAQPNTGSIVFETDVPAGSAVTITHQGSRLMPGNLLFGGQVQNSTRTYQSRPIDALTTWPSALVDHTFAANKRRPFGHYVTVSATTIAQQLIATYAPGFSASYVQAGLPPVTVNFDGTSPLVSCLNQLATLCEGRCKVDYLRRVHLYLPPEPNVPAPDAITRTNPPLNNPPIQFEVDLSQVRTRVYGKGHGETIPTDVLANETILPVNDTAFFSATGGQAITGVTSEGAQTQILTYTGIHAGA